MYEADEDLEASLGGVGSALEYRVAPRYAKQKDEEVGHGGALQQGDTEVASASSCLMTAHSVIQLAGGASSRQQWIPLSVRRWRWRR
jgi:hypothetical protein